MFIGEGQDWLEGEEHAWETLSQLDAREVCRRSKAGFDEPANHYILPLFNGKAFISPERREIHGDSGVVDTVLNKLSHFSRLAVLWYLIKARDIPLSRYLINPRETNGGLIFALGSHILPLDRLIEQYSSNIKGFIDRGVTLGGEPLDYADASVILFPFPRIPIVLLLWKHDEEFPARADMLLDTTCSEHLPTDIIWSTAMMSILLLLI